MKRFELIATSTFGLEAMVKKEVEELGYEITTVQDGKVTYTGDAEAIVLSNLWLRSADRILIKMGEFQATTFVELFDQVASLPWEAWITPDAKFTVNGKSVKSKLFSISDCQSITKKAIVKRLQQHASLPWEAWITPDAKFTVNGKSVKSKLFSISDCQSITKKAIVKRLQQHYKIDWFPETGPSYTVQVSILKDIATLTIDTTGREGLHKRGYRIGQGEAPLKETMASALLQISYWQKGRILYDPCCGSGTFAIEAAMLAKNIAPGLNRQFASSFWPQIPKSLWNELREEAQEAIDQKGNPIIYASDIDRNVIAKARENAEAAGVADCIQFFALREEAQEAIDQKGNPIIYASDIDRNVIAKARENAEAAGVADCIQFFAKPIHKTSLPYGDYGIIIANPPYGERISDPVKISKIHQELRRLIDSNPTWSLYALTSVDTFERDFGKKANKKRKLFNGNLKVDFYQYFGPKPPKDGENFKAI